MKQINGEEEARAAVLSNAVHTILHSRFVGGARKHVATSAVIF